MASSLRAAFANARDRWQIDSDTLKGFYLHTPSNRLFIWEQAQGVLFEFSNDNCIPVWTSADAAANAEIWTMLPLPPTDAAAQMQQREQEDVLSMLVEVPLNSYPGQQMMVHSPEGQEVQFVVPDNAKPGETVTITYTKPQDFVMLRMLHEEDKHVDAGEVQQKLQEFSAKWSLSDEMLARIRKLSLDGQNYLCTTFTLLAGGEPEAKIGRYITHIEKSRPWETISKIKHREHVELKIDPMGAVIGTVLAELAGKPGIAHAHCQISSVKEERDVDSSSQQHKSSSSSTSRRNHKKKRDPTVLRYYVQDLQTTTGTFLDGDEVPASAPGIKLFDGQVLKIGDSSFRVEINYVALPGQEEERDERLQDQQEEFRKLTMFKNRQRKKQKGANPNSPEEGDGTHDESGVDSARNNNFGGPSSPGSTSEYNDTHSTTTRSGNKNQKHHVKTAGGDNTTEQGDDLNLDRAAKRRKRQEKTADTLEDVHRIKTLKRLEQRDKMFMEKENATEFKTKDAQAEAGLATDGTFFGLESETGRAGIGFGQDNDIVNTACQTIGVLPDEMKNLKKQQRDKQRLRDAGRGPEKEEFAKTSLSAMFKKSSTTGTEHQDGANKSSSPEEEKEDKVKYYVKDEEDSKDGESDDDIEFAGVGLGFGGAGLGAG